VDAARLSWLVCAAVMAGTAGAAGDEAATNEWHGGIAALVQAADLEGDRGRYREQTPLFDGFNVELSLSRQSTNQLFSFTGDIFSPLDGTEAGEQGRVHLLVGGRGVWKTEFRFSRLVLYDDLVHTQMQEAFPGGAFLPNDIFRIRTQAQLTLKWAQRDRSEWRFIYAHADTEGDRSRFKDSNSPDPNERTLPVIERVDFRSDQFTLGTSFPVGIIHFDLAASVQHTSSRGEQTERHFGPDPFGAPEDIVRLRDYVFTEGFDAEIFSFQLAGNARPNEKVFVRGDYAVSYTDVTKAVFRLRETAFIPEFEPFAANREAQSVRPSGFAQRANLELDYTPLEFLRWESRYYVDHDESQSKGQLNFNELVVTQRFDAAYETVELGTNQRLIVDVLPRTTVSLQASWELTDQRIRRNQSTFLGTFDPLAGATVHEGDTHGLQQQYGGEIEVRPWRGLTTTAGYTYTLRDFDEEFDVLANDLALENRDRRQHKVTGALKWRPVARLQMQAKGEYRTYERDTKFLRAFTPDVIATIPDSSVQGESWRTSAGAYYTLAEEGILKMFTLHASAGWWKDLFRPDRTAETMSSPQAAPINYRSDVWSYELGCNWQPVERLDFSAALTKQVANGFVEFDVTRASLTGHYRLGSNWTIRAGYVYLDFDEESFNRDDYRAHVGTLGLHYNF
jgi:hypothetical protein